MLFEDGAARLDLCFDRGVRSIDLHLERILYNCGWH